MTSARDIRAMVSSIDRNMHQVRSNRGADVNVDAQKKSLESLVEDIADAAAMLRMAKRSGVDATRLIEKIEVAKKLLNKESSQSGNDRVAPNLPEARVPHVLESPPPPPSSLTGVKQMDSGRKDDDNVSLRSSVVAKNAEELRRREAEIRRRDERREEDAALKRKMEAAEKAMEAVDLEMLRVRHQRLEDDAEEEDQRRGSLSNGSDRIDA